MVVHLATANVDKATSGFDDEPARVGFVVSRAVGSAVTRNRVKRRLRHLMRERVAGLDRGSLLVVRANPAAAEPMLEQYRRERSGELDGTQIAEALKNAPATAPLKIKRTAAADVDERALRPLKGGRERD